MIKGNLEFFRTYILKRHTFSPKEQQKVQEVKCKTAIIVGGTGDIGLATANQLFCAKAAKIALLDTDICKGDKAISSLNCTFGKNKAIFIKTDVSNKTDVHGKYCHEYLNDNLKHQFNLMQI